MNVFFLFGIPEGWIYNLLYARGIKTKEGAGSPSASVFLSKINPYLHSVYADSYKTTVNSELVKSGMGFVLRN